jgi:hypothetical protein
MRPDALLDALVDLVADRIAARIAERREREQYSSIDLPAGFTRRRFAEICRSGRVSDARRDGRIWTCSRAAWEGRRREVHKKPSLDERADALLTRAGLRVVRGNG